MNSDTWFFIFHSVYTKKDGLNIRAICKESREGFKQYVISLERIYPRRTFIAIDTCMNCNEYSSDVQTFRYQEEYPTRLFLHCKKLDCFCKCFLGFVQDMNKEASYPFFNISTKEPFYVSRTRGGVSPGIVTNQRPIIEKNGELYCVVFFSNTIYETIPEASHDQGPYDFVLKKMIPLESCECVSIEKMFLEFMSDKFKIFNI